MEAVRSVSQKLEGWLRIRKLNICSPFLYQQIYMCSPQCLFWPEMKGKVVMKGDVFLFLPHQRPWNYSCLISYVLFLGSFDHRFSISFCCLKFGMLSLLWIMPGWVCWVSFSHTSYKKSPHQLLSHQYFMRGNIERNLYWKQEEMYLYRFKTLQNFENTLI